MEDLRNLFPVTKTHTYLNTASAGLVSTKLVQWRSEHDKKLLQQGSIFRDTHRAILDGVCDQVCNFFSASKHEVALVPNFSFGFNTLLEGIPEGKKVLLLSHDYPSINWAFEHRDFNVCYAEVDENLEQNIEVAVARHKPDIFAFSIVQYLNGIKIDFNFLKQLKAYHPDLLLVADGTQYLGTEPFNFTESAIDVLGGSCYKWMLSGYGNGVFMVKEAVQHSIHPSTIGFNSANGIFSARESIPFMKRFEPGHQDTLTYGSLGQSIRFLEEFGADKISEKLQLLCGKAKEAFIEKGILDLASARRENFSTIFNITGDENLFQKLKNENIICSQRGKGLRVGFHIYNTEEDLHKLLCVL
ncbi:aminotransferase class V-fold PLP-dependent enzyme [Rasiella sp. SM2506]|uniref:aminotransferase class V-fold PLP-dependent enzyme n=1 Tax=Rasiella sp. SM2506 TaxID=3423914 RepID=UPI003D7AB5E6